MIATKTSTSARLLAAELAPDVRGLLAPYLDTIVSLNSGTARNAALKRYPGSPIVALNVMRRHDRLTADRSAQPAGRLRFLIGSHQHGLN